MAADAATSTTLPMAGPSGVVPATLSAVGACNFPPRFRLSQQQELACHADLSVVARRDRDVAGKLPLSEGHGTAAPHSGDENEAKAVAGPPSEAM